MNQKFKITTLILFTLSFGGCAGTSQNGPVYNVLDGAISNQQQRQTQQSARGNVPDNTFKREDAAVGIFNALLQGIVGLFSSDETD